MTYNEETGVYTVTLSEFGTVCQSLEENTVETAYKFNITEIDSIESLTEVIINCPCYCDLSHTTLPSDNTYLLKVFFNCVKLVKSPIIPDGVTSLAWAFRGCTNLKEVPIIPDSVTNLGQAFRDCVNITEVPFISNNVTNFLNAFSGCTNLKQVTIDFNETATMEGTFYGCSNLERIYLFDDNLTKARALVAAVESGGNFLEGVTASKYVRLPYTGEKEITFSDLDFYLKYLDDNTEETAYKLNITGLTTGNLTQKSTNVTENLITTTVYHSDLSKIFFNNRNKYVDISSTVLPSGTKTMTSTFSVWDSFQSYPLKIIGFPELPTTVTNIQSCFRGNEYIKQLRIPNTVDIRYAFQDCVNLERVWLLKSPSYYANAILNCTNLKKMYFPTTANVTTARNNKSSIGLYSELDEKETLVWNFTYYENVPISITELEMALQSLDVNTAEEPYYIQVINITAAKAKGEFSATPSNTASLQSIVLKNPTKFIYINNNDTSYTETITDMSFFLFGCTSVVGFKGFPKDVSIIWSAFVCPSLREIEEIPDSVTDMRNALALTQLEEIRRVPENVTQYSVAFTECPNLKKVYLTKTVSGECPFSKNPNLEKVFVNTEEERQDLISLMSTDESFTNKDLNTIVETLKKGTVNVKTEDGIFTAEIYSDEIALQKTDIQPIKLAKNKKAYYMQTVGQKFLADCKNKGSGTLLKTLINDEPVFVACSAGSFAEPFVKPYDTTLGNYFEITDSTELTIPKEWFGQKGGVMLVCSGKGSGDLGGNGYIRRIEFPSDIKEDININISFIINPDANGLKGNDTGTYTDYYCGKYVGTPHETCYSRSVKGYGLSGFTAGANIVVQIGEKVTTVYGGGGQGGLGGSITYVSSCDRFATSYCILGGEKTITATGGAGGLTGAGTGTRLGANGLIGGQGLSYNSNDLNNAFSDWTGAAKVLIYKYL